MPEFFYSPSIDSAIGQSGSGVWHTLDGDGEKPRVLGVHSKGFVGSMPFPRSNYNSGVLITKDIYDLIINRIGDDSGTTNANLLPENAIIGTDPFVFLDGNDNIQGTYRRERILGNDGNDTIEGGGSDDRIDGGTGTDTAVFAKDLTDTNYDISWSGDEIIVIDLTGDEGTDTLQNIELGEFNGNITDFRDGSPNNSSDQAAPVGASLFDPGVPINLDLAPPVHTADGDAEYTLNISQINSAYNRDLLAYVSDSKPIPKIKKNIGNPLNSLPVNGQRDIPMKYNIAYVIDTSTSIDFDELQDIKDAYIDLTNHFVTQGIADNINFAVISFSDNIVSSRNLNATETITAIQNLDNIHDPHTRYNQGLGEAYNFFRESPFIGQGENIYDVEHEVTNITYFFTDGTSEIVPNTSYYTPSAMLLRVFSNVQAFGLQNSGGSQAVREVDVDFVDSEEGTIITDSSQLSSALLSSGLENEVQQVEIRQNGTLVATLDSSEFTDSPFGLNYTGTVDGLDVSLGATNDIEAEISFVSGSRVATSGTVSAVIASSLDDSGIEPLTTITNGSAGDEEIILGSIDLGANGNEGNDEIIGNNFGNILDGGSGDDTVKGHEGNDTLIGGDGEDILDGGNGIDTVAYLGRLFGDVVIEQTGDITKIDDTDYLLNVEYLQFDDVRVDAETLAVVPLLGSADVSVIEGDAGTTLAEFSFNLDTATTNSVQFDYSTADLDAIAGEDYTPIMGTVIIPPGSTSTTLVVEVIGDNDFESDENFALNISALTGATFANNETELSLLGNIENDDIQNILDPVTGLQYIAEYGVIDNLTDAVQTIDLQKSFTNPVVFAQPLSFNGSSPAIARLDNIDSDSFEIRVQEPSNLDDTHGAEKVSYFVIEAGTWELSNGEILQVGTVDSNQLLTTAWESVAFDEQFDVAPAVFSQVQTKNGNDFVRTRQRNTTVDGFEVGMEEQQSSQNSAHANETLGWLALESGSGSWDGNSYEVGSTGDTVTHNWSNQGFSNTFSEVPQFLASLASYDGADPAGIRYRNLTTDTVEVKVEEDTSADGETNHTTETVDFLALEGSGLLTATPYTPAQPVTFGETGVINLNHNSETINLINSYLNPVVFVQPPSFNGSSPAIVRLENITSDSFTAKIQEPNHLNPVHSTEQANYFVFEAGTWELEDGTILEVGTATSEDLVTGGTFDTIDFSGDFNDIPVAISQVQTDDGADFVRTRQRNVTVSGFDVGMEEEEANKNSAHKRETIGWLAMEKGSGTSGSFAYYADSTGDSVTDAWFDLDFNGLFSNQPQILAGISSYDGSDPVGLRYRSLNATDVEIKLEEDTSVDGETAHTTETVDFLLIEGSGSLSATPLDFIGATNNIPLLEDIPFDVASESV